MLLGVAARVKNTAGRVILFLPTLTGNAALALPSHAGSADTWIPVCPAARNLKGRVLDGEELIDDRA